ncbi:MAG: hypothetical protein QW618_01595 [Nitrososphaerales archaeon]
MIVQLSPVIHRVATFAKPEDLMLTKGSWVRFTEAWPDTYKWARGKVFVVEHEPIIVPYEASYILPGNDYKDIDLSNAAGGLKLYPESEGVLYEALVGFKPGKYLVHTYIPKDKYVYSLAEASMFPNVLDPLLKYLGAKTYEDSPHTSPLLKLYFIKDMPAFIFRMYVLEGVDFEKCTIKFQINKCQLREIPSPTAEQREKALLLRYYTELTGF